MLIVLDTNILIQHSRLDSAAMTALLESVAMGEHTLFVPTLVLDEYDAHVRDQIMRAESSISKSLKTIRRLTAGAPSHPLTDDAIDEMVNRQSAFLRSNLDSAGVVVLPYPAIPHESVTQRALDRRRLFDDQGRRGYRDALIWETVLEVATRGDTILVTANTRDFGDELQSFHPDLQTDLRE